MAEAFIRGLNGHRRASLRVAALAAQRSRWLRHHRRRNAATQSAQAHRSPLLGTHREAGETLSAIARLYDIHVETLRFLNGIQGNDLAVGTKLLVPARSSEL